MGIFHGVVASRLVSWMLHVCLASVALPAKNQSMKMLPCDKVGVAGKQSCGILLGVKVCNVGRLLRAHGESGRVSGLKRTWVLAGANFNAWRRRAVYCEVHVACRDGMYSYPKRKQSTTEAI